MLRRPANDRSASALRAAKRWLGPALGAVLSITSACSKASPAAPDALTISAQPQSQIVTTGGTASLGVAANGAGPLTYQWYIGPSGTVTTSIAGATAASYTTAALTSTTSYWVRISNARQSVDSATATVTVLPQPPSEGGATAPVITTQPQSQTVQSGRTASITVVASGALPLAYQWYVGSSGTTTSPIGGATAASYTTPMQRISAAGYGGAFPWGENIAGGQPSPQTVVDDWMLSPGHCSNIMSGSFHVIGVGHAYTGTSTYRHYWTQDFGGS